MIIYKLLILISDITINDIEELKTTPKIFYAKQNEIQPKIK